MYLGIDLGMSGANVLLIDAAQRWGMPPSVEVCVTTTLSLQPSFDQT